MFDLRGSSTLHRGKGDDNDLGLRSSKVVIKELSNRMDLPYARSMCIHVHNISTQLQTWRAPRRSSECCRNVSIAIDKLKADPDNIENM